MIVAGTGHRPKYLPCKYKKVHPWKTKIITNLEQWLIDNKPELVISGMAIGWDTWLALSALKLNIPLCCCIPFSGQQKAWPSESRLIYEQIALQAAEIDLVSVKYSQEAFLKRDRRMVDRADKVVALWNPKAKYGGTYYTVNYTKKQNKPVINFWENDNDS